MFDANFLTREQIFQLYWALIPLLLLRNGLLYEKNEGIMLYMFSRKTKVSCYKQNKYTLFNGLAYASCIVKYEQ